MYKQRLLRDRAANSNTDESPENITPDSTSTDTNSNTVFNEVLSLVHRKEESTAEIIITARRE